MNDLRNGRRLILIVVDYRQMESVSGLSDDDDDDNDGDYNIASGESLSSGICG